MVEGKLSPSQIATLKFCWTQVAEGRVAAALIVKAFDVMKDVLPCGRTRSIGLVVDQLDSLRRNRATTLTRYFFGNQFNLNQCI